MNLGCRQEELLKEAQRRFQTFNSTNLPITKAWTGLGSATEYKTVSPRYMVNATSPNPGCRTWWKLTRAGAAIVQEWIDAENPTH
jgi:hypothetical protein